MFEVYLDGANIVSKENTKPLDLEAAKFMGGNRFDAPADAKIKNLFIWTKSQDAVPALPVLPVAPV